MMTTKQILVQTQIQTQADPDGDFWVHWPESDSSDLHITKASDTINHVELAECHKVSTDCWGALVTMDEVKHVICKDCLSILWRSLN